MAREKHAWMEQKILVCSKSPTFHKRHWTTWLDAMVCSKSWIRRALDAFVGQTRRIVCSCELQATFYVFACDPYPFSVAFCMVPEKLSDAVRYSGDKQLCVIKEDFGLQFLFVWLSSMHFHCVKLTKYRIVRTFASCLSFPLQFRGLFIIDTLVVYTHL